MRILKETEEKVGARVRAMKQPECNTHNTTAHDCPNHIYCSLNIAETVTEHHLRFSVRICHPSGLLVGLASLYITRRDCMQGTASRLDVLREEHKMAVQKRGAFENVFRTFATEECDMENDLIDAKIEKARSESHKQNKRLQAIHAAHQVVLAKETEIKEAGNEEESSQDEVTHPRTHKQM